MRSRKENINEEILDSEENETIALSTDELDDILSEAEIVQEKPAKKGLKKAEKAPGTEHRRPCQEPSCGRVAPSSARY